MDSTPCTAALLVVSAFLVASPCLAEAIQNPSFEQGLAGWDVTFDPHRETRCEVLDQQDADGGRCVRFATANPYSWARLEQTIVLPEPERKDYVIGFSVKASSPVLLRGVYPHVSYVDAKGRAVPSRGDGWYKHYILPWYLYLYAEAERDGWQRRSYWLPVASQAAGVRLVVTVQCPPGEVLLDDFSLAPAPPRELPADLLHYAPFLNMGVPPIQRLGQLMRSKSPFLDNAAIYHRALSALTDAQERLELLERADFYTGRRLAEPLRKRFDEAVREIGERYETYGRLYLAREPEKLAAQFTPKAEATTKRVRGLIEQIDAAFAQLARARGIAWAGPKDLAAARPIRFPDDGHLREAVFSSHSMHLHFGMEQCLGDFWQVRWEGRIAPKLDPGTNTFDWSEAKRRIEASRKRGVQHHIITDYYRGSRGSICVSPKFAKDRADDPEIYLQLRDFEMPKKRPGYRGPFNYFNPAVRDAAMDLIANYFSRFRALVQDHERLIYIVNWEGSGPYVAGRGGQRMVGYGKVAQREFQAHLRRKYGTIDALNRAHRAQYGSFGEIEQPRTDLREAWSVNAPALPRIDPMRYEFSKWTHLVHAQFGRGTYEAIKKADPKAIVFSDFLTIGLCLGFDPLLLCQGCDWITNHGTALREVLPQNAMLASLKPYHGKQLATFEDQWGLQEDAHRPGEEIARRLNIIRHMGRNAARGALFQSWWYSYCDGPFVVGYGSGNWADPVFDLSTFRYCATGLRTGIERVRRLERQFAETTKVRSRIVLIMPEASEHHQYMSRTHGVIRDLYRLLYDTNRRFEFLTESLVLSGRAQLSEYDAVLIPNAPYFPVGLWDKITPWVEQGGLLMCVGPCGLYDELGFDNPQCLIQPLIETPFPDEQLSARDRWKWDNGSVVKARTVGRGKVVLVSKPIGEILTDTPTRGQLMSHFAATPPAATSPDTSAEVELRTDAKGTHYVFALNPETDCPIEGTIRVQGRFTDVRDLAILGGLPVKANGDADDTTSFRFRLAPGQYTFLQLTW